jgi:hypothetical protein
VYYVSLYYTMSKHIKISVEELLVDTDIEGYRLDGFRILARMIARRYMSDMSQAQATTSGDESRQENLSQGTLETKGE